MFLLQATRIGCGRDALLVEALPLAKQLDARWRVREGMHLYKWDV
jgi:hypothetical protein